MQDTLIYTDKQCINCAILKKYLTIKNINFTELNIDDASDEIKGMNSVPIVVVGRVAV